MQRGEVEYNRRFGLVMMGFEILRKNTPCIQLGNRFDAQEPLYLKSDFARYLKQRKSHDYLLVLFGLNDWLALKYIERFRSEIDDFDGL